MNKAEFVLCKTDNLLHYYQIMYGMNTQIR